MRDPDKCKKLLTEIFEALDKSSYLYQEYEKGIIPRDEYERYREEHVEAVMAIIQDVFRWCGP